MFGGLFSASKGRTTSALATLRGASANKAKKPAAKKPAARKPAAKKTSAKKKSGTGGSRKKPLLILF